MEPAPRSSNPGLGRPGAPGARSSDVLSSSLAAGRSARLSGPAGRMTGVEDVRMKAKRLLGALLPVGLSLAAAAQATDVQAKPEKNAAPAEPPITKKAITITLPAVIWGVSPSQLGDRIDKIL